MSNVAIELNDASLAIAGDGVLRLEGPGYAAAAGNELRLGTAARPLIRLSPRQSSRRFWAEMSETPLPQAFGGCLTSADLVHQHLARLWESCEGADAAVLAVMPHWSDNQLGLLLGIARDIAMPVAGLVDSAVAASRRAYTGRALWHLEAGLDAAWLTRIEQGAGATAGSRYPVDRFGTETIERGCAEFLAGRFVDCSRFDPLHDARSEQQLFDRVPGWLQAASRQERVNMTLEHGGNAFEAWVDAADLRRRVARLCEPLIRQLRSLLSPREPSVLQLHARLADFPGVIEALTLLPACTVVLLEPGAAARGALRLRVGESPAGAVTLAKALPWDQPPEEAGVVPQGVVGLAPTHVVFDGRAWRIGVEPVQVGTDLGADDYGIRLGGRSQAVSRRHCLVQAESGRVMVHDQSRYGTWLNGHRIDGSAVLQAGDVLSIGQPPQELALIAEMSRAP